MNSVHIAYKQKYNSVWPETEAEICPVVSAAIRSGINKLDQIGAVMHADYWSSELYDVDGSRIVHRWNSGNQALIEKDVRQQLSLG